jgi:hypothetical protein
VGIEEAVAAGRDEDHRRDAEAQRPERERKKIIVTSLSP